MYTCSLVSFLPYCVQVFTRVLRSFQLPVGPKPMMVVSHKDLFDAVKSATLVVSLLVRPTFTFRLSLQQGWLHLL